MVRRTSARTPPRRAAGSRPRGRRPATSRARSSATRWAAAPCGSATIAASTLLERGRGRALGARSGHPRPGWSSVEPRRRRRPARSRRPARAADGARPAARRARPCSPVAPATSTRASGSPSSGCASGSAWVARLTHEASPPGPPTSALIASRRAATSSSVSVRSGARNSSRRARLLRPSPTWSPAVEVEDARGRAAARRRRPATAARTASAGTSSLDDDGQVLEDGREARHVLEVLGPGARGRRRAAPGRARTPLRRGGPTAAGHLRVELAEPARVGAADRDRRDPPRVEEGLLGRRRTRAGDREPLAERLEGALERVEALRRRPARSRPARAAARPRGQPSRCGSRTGAARSPRKWPASGPPSAGAGSRR